jgi:hypothetical protein
MRGRVTSALACSWALAACGGGASPGGGWGWAAPPSVEALVVRVDRCGAWTAWARASGVGELVFTLDGAEVGRTRLEGGVRGVTAEGRLAPGATAILDATAGSSALSRPVDVPAIGLEAAVTPQPSGGARVVVVSDCPIPGARFVPRTDAGDALPPVPVDRAGVSFVLELPAGPRTLGGEVRLAPERGGGPGAVVPVPDVALPDPPAPAPSPSSTGDRDGDGWIDLMDCAPDNPAVSPGAAELPVVNGIDDDCDGVVDEDTRGRDDDGDGMSEDQGDCDDDDPRRRPGMAEVADCRDQDCDGAIDEGVSLTAKDDRHEPNARPAPPTSLAESGQRAFRSAVRFVTSSLTDEEWVSFVSDDGLLDQWAVEVRMREAAPDAVYEITVEGPAGRAQDRLEGEGGVVRLTGALLRPDSGRYTVRIRPVAIPRPWCPVVVEFVSL